MRKGLPIALILLLPGCALMPASLGGGWRALADDAAQSDVQGLSVQAARQYQAALQSAERDKASPEDRLALLDPLARLLVKSRQFAQAELMMTRAAELEGQASGADSLRQAERLEALAEIRFRAAKFDRMVEPMLQASGIRQRIQEPDDPAIIESLIQLASYQEVVDRSEEARAVLREAVGLGRSYAVTSDRHQADIHFANALLAAQDQQHRSAMSELMKVLALMENPAEGPRQNLAGLWLMIGAEHIVLGTPQRALEAYERCLEEIRNDPGEGTWIEGVVRLHLAQYHAEQWEIAEAAASLDAAEAVFQRELSPDHYYRAAVLAVRARLDQIAGDCEGEERKLNEAIRAIETTLGRDHSYMAELSSKLAGLRLQQGRYFEAEPLMNRALEIRRRHERANSPLLAVALANLGIFCLYEGRVGEAVAHMEQAVGIWEQVGMLHHFNAAFTRLHLGWVYQAERRFKEAERPIREGVADIRKAWGTSHRFYLFGLSVLHEYLDNYHARDEAVEVEREVEAITQQLEQRNQIKPCAGFAERQTI